MNLNLFENIKNDIKLNENFKNFMEDLTNFLSNIISKGNETSEIKESILDENTKRLQDYRKEGHLYLVTEDIDNKIFLWDLTDKPKNEIEEVDFPKDLLDIATEGTVFKYKNGTYELYSEEGYEMLFENKDI